MRKVGILKGILFNLCPSCYQGKVFRSFLGLNKNCPHCDFLILKEEGYAIGSMIAAYFISFFAAVPVFLVGHFYFEVDVVPLIVVCCIEMTVLGPLFYRIATLLWLWVETALDRKLN